EGMWLTPGQVLEEQTVRRLARVVQWRREPAAEQGEVTGDVVTTPVQWAYLDASEGEDVARFVQWVGVEAAERLDTGWLPAACRALQAQHDPLRPRFPPP